MKRSNVRRKRPVRQATRRAETPFSTTKVARRRLVLRVMKVAGPALALLVVVGFGACGDRTQSLLTTAELLPECEHLIDVERACATRQGTAATHSFDQHLTAMLKELSVSGKTVEEKTLVKNSCLDNSRRLEEACR